MTLNGKKSPSLLSLLFLMAKKKRSKPAQANISENVALAAVEDDELLDDLMAQIDGGNASQEVAATVVQQVQSNKADEIEASPAGKKDSRVRFEARKVCFCLL